MIYHPPRLPYSGLTVILSNPSRFDTQGTPPSLISGNAGNFFDKALGIPRQSCDIRCLGEEKPFLPNTKSVLLLGDPALQHYFSHLGVSLKEQRGSPLLLDGIPCVSSFLPQDAMDVKDWEGSYNPEAEGYGDTESADDEGDDTEAAKSTHGKTRRPNWRFWLTQDTRKAVRFSKTGLEVYPEPIYNLYPTSSEVIQQLTTTKNDTLYFDIETDRFRHLTCFGYSFGCVPNVYSIPVFDYTGELCYEDFPQILRALSVAFRENTVVIHNSLFDLSVMAQMYHVVPPRNNYDTMLSSHRMFPEVEKSLGHCISLYTDLPYHKNEGVFEPHNHEQQEQLWSYNAKDVYSLKILKSSIDSHAAELKATDSIAQVNSSIRPYLLMMLQGIRFSEEARQQILSHNDRRLVQIKRILNCLTGVNFNPVSPKQVATLLYDKDRGLGIKKPAKDLTNSKTLLKLLTKLECPPVSAIMEYRRIAKESGMVKFEPWIL